MSRALRAAAIALALMSGATGAIAEPIGRWWSGFGQGTVEYGIRNDSAGSDTVYIACAPDRTSIRFAVGGENPKPNSTILVTIDGDEFELWADDDGYFQTYSRAASDNFHLLWDSMRAGQTMRVRLASGKSTVFTLKDAAKVLPRERCETDFER